MPLISLNFLFLIFFNLDIISTIPINGSSSGLIEDWNPKACLSSFQLHILALLLHDHWVRFETHPALASTAPFLPPPSPPNPTLPSWPFWNESLLSGHHECKWFPGFSSWPFFLSSSFPLSSTMAASIVRNVDLQTGVISLSWTLQAFSWYFLWQLWSAL